MLPVGLLLAGALGCGMVPSLNSEPEPEPVAEVEQPCTLPLAGRSYEVVEHTVDPDGCTEGEPATGVALLEFLACPYDWLILSQDGVPRGCVKGPELVSTQTGLNTCRGGVMTDFSVRRGETLERCGRSYRRMDVELAEEGERVVVLLRDFDAHAEPNAEGDCPAFGNWTAGEDLPTCSRRERIVARRMR